MGKGTLFSSVALTLPDVVTSMSTWTFMSVQSSQLPPKKPGS